MHQIARGAVARLWPTRGADAGTTSETSALSLGVTLVSPAGAVTVNPVQTTTYDLKSTSNPITFGAATKINAGKSHIGLYGAGADWNITNKGSITGSFGIYISTSTAEVINSGFIGGYNFGVSLAQGGKVNNLTGGYIAGIIGEFEGSLSVTNAGVIGHGVSAGVYFRNGGELTNLAGARITGEVESVAGRPVTVNNQAGASISFGGYAISGPATITNAGVIASTNLSAIGFVAGTLNNKSPGAIYGAKFGFVGEGAITNYGSISGGTAGLSLQGGTFSNEHGGLVSGAGEGLYLTFPLSRLTNAGRIRGTGAAGVGVELTRGGRLNNQAGGTISGVAQGVLGIGDAADISNAGDITSTSSSSIYLVQGGEVTNEATGRISGAIGVYFRVGSVGAVTNAGRISGSSFGAELNDGGQVTNRAAGAISGQTAVCVSGAAGTVTNGGQINGVKHGVLISAAGTVTNQAGGQITATNATGQGVEFDGGGTVVNQVGGVITATYGVVIKGAAGTVTNAGTIDGKFGSVAFSGGGANTLTLQTGSTLVTAATGSKVAGATNALVLQGTGEADNKFFFFNTLSVQASATWTLNGPAGFGKVTISSGTLQIGDATHSAAELNVTGVLTNNAVIEVAAGTADIAGAVTGTGKAVIMGGTLELGSTFTQNVAFEGAGGLLELAKSQAYAGSISGFSPSGATSLDLGDIGFDAQKTNATFVENGAKTQGVLTVTDGTHTANITLLGDFTGGSFEVSGDGHGGTTVAGVAGAAKSPAVLPFIAAMASLAASASHSVTPAESGRSTPLLLLGAAHTRPK